MERGLSLDCAPDRLGQPLHLDVFQDIRNSAGLQGRKDVLVIMIRSQDDNLSAWADVLYPARGFHAAHHGHYQVHEDNIWNILFRQFDCFQSRIRFRNDRKLWLRFQEEAHTLPHHFMVVD
jgi:hypothetical protein